MLKAARVSTIPGTILNFIRGQADFWKDSGFDWFYVSSPDEDLKRIGARDKVRTIPVQMTREVTPLRDLRALARMVSIFRKERPLILQTHTPKAGLLGQSAGVLARVPCRVHTIHGLPYLETTGLTSKLLKWSDRAACRCATSVTFVAPWLAEQAVADHVCRPDRLGLITQSLTGVDGQEFQRTEAVSRRAAELRAQEDIAPDALVVGYVGRLVRHKGINDLAAAWPLVLEKLPGARLVLIGEWESEDPVLPETRRYLESDPSVRYIGSTSEIVPWYAAFDLFVLPTYREGLPKVLIEASCLEVPVLATDIRDCHAGMVDGITGVTVPVHDVPELAAGIVDLLQHPERRKSLGAAGRAWAGERFSPRERWEEMAGLYRTLLAEKGLLPKKSPPPEESLPSQTERSVA